MILYSYLYEREGNDAWLKDYVELHSNELGLYLEHKVRWNGWNGEIHDDFTIELDENDLPKSQEILDKYIDDNSLFVKYSTGEEHGIKINLKELICTE